MWRCLKAKCSLSRADGSEVKKVYKKVKVTNRGLNKKKIEYQIRNLGAAFKHIFGPKSWNLMEPIFKGSKAKGEHVEASL